MWRRREADSSFISAMTLGLPELPDDLIHHVDSSLQGPAGRAPSPAPMRAAHAVVVQFAVRAGYSGAPRAKGGPGLTLSRLSIGRLSCCRAAVALCRMCCTRSDGPARPCLLLSLFRLVRRRRGPVVRHAPCSRARSPRPRSTLQQRRSSQHMRWQHGAPLGTIRRRTSVW